MKILKPEEVTHIAVHHTATSEETSVDVIKWYHTEKKGWSDIGYHYLVDTFGNVHKGRDTQFVGAHVRGANNTSIGVAIIGDYTESAPSEEMTTSLVQLIKEIQATYKIPDENVLPHRSFPEAKTDCFGKFLPDDWLQEILKVVEPGLEGYSDEDLLNELLRRSITK